MKEESAMIDIQGIPALAARLAAAQKATYSKLRKKSSSKMDAAKISVGPSSTFRAKTKVA
jgi:hypothetical protein